MRSNMISPFCRFQFLSFKSCLPQLQLRTNNKRHGGVVEKCIIQDAIPEHRCDKPAIEKIEKVSSGWMKRVVKDSGEVKVCSRDV